MLQLAMPNQASPPIDVARAHRYFSSDCFNKTWTLIEKSDRTADEDEAMVLCALSSLWHWTQRPDRTDLNLSVGHWQVARVYALVGQGEIGILHAKRSLELAAGAEAFYIGSAHEAVARNAAVLNDDATFRFHLAQARTCAESVNDLEDRSVLEKDLNALQEESHK